ncbi:uncharacterized protein LOC101896456 [Musca domestica]|uniref:Uncharacterized protein LOC101896456 n=1 Tax=Musca domestica TaxID=7370 RepID=A0A1I8NGQ7_MUSDO|nr:uncharacterized protein LOC101896456 [Musca domestica]
MKSSIRKSFLLDILFCSALAVAFTDVVLEQTWTYELKSIETFSSDLDKLRFGEFKVERISRGVYAGSGSFTINADIVEGDSHMIEFHAYRSENGKDYKPIPLKTPRQHLYEYFNTFYKEYAMNSLKNCSNMPAFEGKFVPPLEKKTYVLEKCQFDQSAFPQHMQEGFYKVDMAGSGEVEWHFIFVVEIENI